MEVGVCLLFLKADEVKAARGSLCTKMASRSSKSENLGTYFLPRADSDEKINKFNLCASKRIHRFGMFFALLSIFLLKNPPTFQQIQNSLTYTFDLICHHYKQHRSLWTLPSVLRAAVTSISYQPQT